jgi:hypothetical protein
MLWEPATHLTLFVALDHLPKLDRLELWFVEREEHGIFAFPRLLRRLAVVSIHWDKRGGLLTMDTAIEKLELNLHHAKTSDEVCRTMWTELRRGMNKLRELVLFGREESRGALLSGRASAPQIEKSQVLVMPRRCGRSIKKGGKFVASQRRPTSSDQTVSNFGFTNRHLN